MSSINSIISDVLVPALSIIGLFLLLTGGYKAIVSYRNTHNGDEAHMAAVQIVIGLAFLFFGVFLLPSMQSAVDSMSSGTAGINSDGPVSITEQFASASDYKSSSEWEDASSPYKFFIKAAGNIYGRTILTVFNAIYSGANIMTGTGDSVMSTAQNYINNQVVKNGIEAMMAVGGSIAILFFVFSLVQLGQEERLTIEVFIKHFSKFFIALILIVNSYNMYTAFFAFGNEVTSYLVGGSASTYTISETDKEAVIDYMTGVLFKQDVANLDTAEDETLNIWAGLGTAASTLPVGLLLLIAACALLGVMYFIAFSRLLELGARAIFLPVALGLIADDGWRGAGGRYIKKLIALCAQIAVLVVISIISANIFGKVSTSILGGEDIVGSLVAFLGIGFAVVSVMFKSIGITNDVFGA